MTRITLILVMLAASTGTVCACRCGPIGPPCEAAWKADAVFIGQVIFSRLASTEGPDKRQWSLRRVRLQVKESFRGVDAPQLDVLTGIGWGDCGFVFEEGQDYLVYAYRGTESADASLGTGSCTRTRSLSKADEDLEYLRNLHKSTSSLSGGLVRDIRKAGVYLPMPDITVLVEGKEESFKLTSNKNGKFEKAEIPPGSYRVMPVLPNGLTASPKEKVIDIAEKACAFLHFVVESNGRLKGIVINAFGQPIEKAEITMMEAGVEKYRGFLSTSYSDKEGRYAFSRIPSGKYLLGIRYDGLTSQERPFPLLYYPGTENVNDAKLIVIGEGEALEDFNLHMPNLPSEYVVSGVVVWPDGRAVSGARVGYASDGVTYAVPVSEDGKFSFSVYEGVSVAVNAHVEVGNKPLRTEWVQVGAGSSLKLVIPSD